MQHANPKLLVAAACTIALYGCGGSSSSTPEPVLLEVPADLSPMQVSMKPLSGSSSRVEQIIKNGVYLRSQQGSINFPTSVPTPNEASDSGASGRYSQTITQESDVDEADRIKYDGNYLYIVSNGNYPELLSEKGEKSGSAVQTSVVAQHKAASIRVLEKQTDGSMVAQSEIKVLADDESGYINGIYLAEDRLAAIYDQYNYSIQTLEPAPAIDIWRPMEQNFGLQLVNTENPAETSNIVKYQVDGYVISSRRIGDRLIVASTFSPDIPKLNTEGATAEEQKLNYNQILRTDISEFLPKYTDQSGAEHALVSADSCYVQDDAAANESFDSIVTISSFDMNDGSLQNSSCIVAVTDNFYASANALYLFSTGYYEDGANSVVHKFSLADDTIDYAASGNVDGMFGWNQPQLRFSEKGDYLRVVSSKQSNDGELNHKLNVLKQDGTALNLVAQLPNDANPAPIGKPGEDVQAVRYNGDKAYIVTFLRRDPLYVIDLSDNMAPSVLGELDIPGYSAYLHPLGDNYIMGVGQQVDDTITIQPVDPQDTSGTATGESPIEEGAKVELYDVTDPANPKVVNTIVYANGYTPVEWDYHALTYLPVDDNHHKFALPIESWEESTDEEGGKVWQRKVSLKLVDINLAGDASMTSAGEVLPTAEKELYYGGWDDRAVIHGDLIYYVHGDYVWQSSWTTPTNSYGPY